MPTISISGAVRSVEDSLPDTGQFGADSSQHLFSAHLAASDRNSSASRRSGPSSVAAAQGGDRVYATAYKGVYVSDSYSGGVFPNRVTQALNKIADSQSGRMLLDSIGKSSTGPNGKKVLVRYDQEPATTPLLTDKQAQKHHIYANDFGRSNAKALKYSTATKVFGMKIKNGPGTKAEIDWSPNASLRLDRSGRPTGIQDGNSAEAHLTLAHELVHASHILKGDYKVGGSRHDPSTGAGKEELRAVGLGKYAGNPVSENSIRSQLDYRLRTQYGTVRRDVESDIGSIRGSDE